MHEGFVLTADAISTIARLLRRAPAGKTGSDHRATTLVMDTLRSSDPSISAIT